MRCRAWFAPLRRSSRVLAVRANTTRRFGQGMAVLLLGTMLGLTAQAATPNCQQPQAYLQHLLETQQWAAALPWAQAWLQREEIDAGATALSLVEPLELVAALHMRQQQWPYAEIALVRALTIRQKQLGPMHPEVSDGLLLMAELNWAQHKTDDATIWARQAVDLFEHNPAPDGPRLLQALQRLAQMEQSLGRMESALQHWQQAAELAEARPVSAEFPVLELHQQAADLAFHLRHFDLAAVHYGAVLHWREQTLGRTDALVDQALNNLAYAYVNQGLHAEAEPLFARALQQASTRLGAAHPQLITMLHGLGHVAAQRGDMLAAEAYFLRGQKLAEQGLGREHPMVAYGLNNRVQLRIQQKNWHSAAALNAQALRILERHFGRQAAQLQYPRQQQQTIQSALAAPKNPRSGV